MMHTTSNTEYKYYGDIPNKDIKYYGKMYYSDGTSYQGYFLNGMKHGYGEETTLDGYNKGYYQNGILNGKVVSYTKSKGIYTDGYYNNGQLNGECLFFDDKNNLVNRGTFKNGKSCVAIFETIYKNNLKREKLYEGFIYDDKYNGFGKLYQNDYIYIGNFTSGRKDGKFLICYLDGRLAYSPQNNIDIMIDIEKVNHENFLNYKNTVIFNNDMFDDNRKIVYKEHDIVKYIGKFNTDLKFEDDNGTYYNATNSYVGKFSDGKFISGVYNFTGGKYKGSFNGLSISGQGIVEFDDGTKYTGEFENYCSKNGTYQFKYDNVDSTIDCLISFNLHQVNFDTSNNTVFKNGDNKYIGKFNISKNGAQSVKLQFSSGKHYIKDNLIYEGDFKNFKYHGSGTKYHTNGNINITGIFEMNEPFKAEYYDENGVLIFSDDGTDQDYNGLPELLAMPQLVSETANLLNMLQHAPDQVQMNNGLLNILQNAPNHPIPNNSLLFNLMNIIQNPQPNQNLFNNVLNPEDEDTAEPDSDQPE